MPELADLPVSDLTAFAACIAALLAYYRYLGRRLRHDPNYTVQAVHRAARRAWVESVMQKSRDILAVQTLRNSTMAATFLASTAVLLIVGVLTLSSQGDKIAGTWHALNVLGGVDSGTWLAKLLLLLVDLVAAFFNFSMAIRLFNHVGYLINVPLQAKAVGASPERVAAMLNRAADLYGNGMRAYYITVPLLFWLFGPLFLVLATLGLIVFLYRTDRAHDPEK